MPEFDPRKWEHRVRTRHRRRVKKSAEALKENNKLTADLKTIKGIAEVVAWCNLRRINVEFSKSPGGYYSSNTRTIYINGQQSVEKQLYVLLHECGHLLIDDRSESTEFRFKNGYYSEEQGIKRKFIYRCTVLEEEFEAWHRGRKLATKLGIEIDDVRFSTLKAKFLKSYMKWALGDPNYQKGGPG